MYSILGDKHLPQVDYSLIPCDETNKIVYDPDLNHIITNKKSYLRKYSSKRIEETSAIFQNGEKVTREIFSFDQDMITPNYH